MPVIIAGGGGVVTPPVILWSVLGDYEALIAEASHTFSFPAVDFDADSKLVLIFGGAVTASLAIQMRINGLIGVAYFYDGRKIGGGVETLIDGNSQAQFELISSSGLDVAAASFFGTVDISISQRSIANLCHITSVCAGRFTNQVMVGLHSSSFVSLTDIELRASASTWEIGTRATLYKVARA